MSIEMSTNDVMTSRIVEITRSLFRHGKEAVLKQFPDKFVHWAEESNEQELASHEGWLDFLHFGDGSVYEVEELEGNVVVRPINNAYPEFGKYALGLAYYSSVVVGRDNLPNGDFSFKIPYRCKETAITCSKGIGWRTYQFGKRIGAISKGTIPWKKKLKCLGAMMCQHCGAYEKVLSRYELQKMEQGEYVRADVDVCINCQKQGTFVMKTCECKMVFRVKKENHDGEEKDFFTFTHSGWEYCSFFCPLTPLFFTPGQQRLQLPHPIVVFIAPPHLLQMQLFVYVVFIAP